MSSIGSLLPSTHPLQREFSEARFVVPEVERCLGAALDDCVRLSPPVAHLRAIPGKRLRALVLVGFAFLESPSGDTRRRAFQAAAAVEMIHEGSLVHDDILDGSVMRRGQHSVAAGFGIRCAADAGVYLVARGVSVLASREVGGGIESDVDMLRRLAYSQMLERMPAATTSLAQRQRVLEVMDGKTGALFTLAARAGLRICGSSGRSLRVDPALAGEFALELARGYQIRDDILDLTGDLRLGKPGGSDLENGIHSWPVLLWAQRSWAERTNRLRLSRGDVHECQAIRQEILASGSVRMAARDAQKHFDSALTVLGFLPDGNGRQLLAEIVGGLPIH